MSGNFQPGEIDYCMAHGRLKFPDGRARGACEGSGSPYIIQSTENRVPYDARH